MLPQTRTAPTLPVDAAGEARMDCSELSFYEADTNSVALLYDRSHTLRSNVARPRTLRARPSSIPSLDRRSAPHLRARAPLTALFAELGRARGRPDEPRGRAEARRLPHRGLPRRARRGATCRRGCSAAERSPASTGTATGWRCLRPRHCSLSTERAGEGEEGQDEAGPEGRRPWGHAPARPGAVAQEERAYVECGGEEEERWRRGDAGRDGARGR